jgi:uncharacterized protein YndB with AHSA1/START domain
LLKWIAIIVLVLGGAIALVALLGTLLPAKHTAMYSATFKQSPQQIWNVITGPPTWRPDVQRFEELPPHDGHRMWREYGSQGQKMTYEVIESDPPQKLVTRIADPHLPFGGAWTYLIMPVDGGSTLTIVEHGEVYNPIFRFVSRYIMGYNTTLERYFKALDAKLNAQSSTQSML